MQGGLTMTKTYCDLCSIECKEYKEEYQLPQEFSRLYFDFNCGYAHHSCKPSTQVHYTPCKSHLCQNCAKIIYLFIQGMKKGDNK